MTRCKQCLSRMEPRNGLCPVCGLDAEKNGGDLVGADKKVRLFARAIRILAMFHLVFAAAFLMTLPHAPMKVPVFLQALMNLILGFGLVNFSLKTKKAAVVYYFLIGMVSVVSIQHGSAYIGGIILCLFAVYIVGNPTSRSIFERQPRD